MYQVELSGTVLSKFQSVRYARIFARANKGAIIRNVKSGKEIPVR